MGLRPSPLARVMARPIDRLTAKYEVAPSGCWLWTAALAGKGYGKFYMDGRLWQAHRASYVLHVGPIPDDLPLDHLCRVHHCVNPAHLEPVTTRENTLRGENFAAVHAAKSTCPKGHQYDYVSPRGERGCRTCRREQTYASRRRAKGR